MLSKLAIAYVAALAVVAQAGHKHHPRSHNGTYIHNPFSGHDHQPSGHQATSAGFPGEAGVSSGAAPYPTSTGGSSLLSTGAVAPLLTTGAVPTYTTTKIVTKLITYCPGPTTITQNGKAYTATAVYNHWPYDCPPLLMGLGNDSYYL